MKYLQYISTIIIAATTLSSCEKTIDVDTPPIEKRLALYSIGETGVPTYLYVKSTAAIKDRKYSPILDITNATVLLYRDGVPTDTMKNSGGFGYSCGTLMEAGRKYTIKVSAPNLPTAEATCVVPVNVPIVKMERTPNARRNADGGYEDAIVLTFDDPAAPGDCYIVEVLPPQDSGYFQYGFCIYAPDVSVETPGGDIADAETCLDNDGIFLRDALFNGKRKELKIFVNSGNIAPQYFGIDTLYSTIKLIHVPEDYLRYRQTRKIANNSNGNPFAEPANVFTNVTDGYGIFSVISTSDVLIK
jgi:hypothetical protein